MKDYLHSLLKLEENSRKKNNFNKNPNCDWSSFKVLEETFLFLFPDSKENYLNFMNGEKKKWGNNFNEAFKKHSLATFLAGIV